MPKPKSRKPDAGKAAQPKGAARQSARKKGKGSSMGKLLFLVVFCGAVYAAFAIPYKGRTMADRAIARAKLYIETDSDEAPSNPTHKTPADKRQVARKDSPHAPPAAGVSPNAAPKTKPSSEQITRADRDALDRLIPH